MGKNCSFSQIQAGGFGQLAIGKQKSAAPPACMLTQKRTELRIKSHEFGAVAES